MLKQLKRIAPRILGAVCTVSVAALLIVEVAGANPPPAGLRRLQEFLIDSKRRPTIENESFRAAGEISDTADGIGAEGVRKSDKVWTVQFRSPPEFARGQPFPLGEHPPFGAGGLGFAGGASGFPEGGPPKGAPKRACLEDINRQMGFYGYTKSKLQLTDNQKATWMAIENALDSEMQKMRVLCETLPNEVTGVPGILERSDFIERSLAAKLELVQALKVPVRQLVEQLTAGQRAVLDAPPPLPPFD